MALFTVGALVRCRLGGVGVIGGTVMRGPCQNEISCSYLGFFIMCAVCEYYADGE